MDRVFDFIAENGAPSVGALVIAVIVGLQGHIIAASLLIFLALLHSKKNYIENSSLKWMKEPMPTITIIGLALIAYFGFDRENETVLVSEESPPQITTTEEDLYGADLEQVANCEAVDGDTLRCGEEDIRLLGIDAPEMPGHCQPGRVCVQGDPFASKNSVEALLEPRMEIIRFGWDRYGRTLAMVYVSEGSLSCRQLRTGNARYIPEWDNEGALAADCPLQQG